MLSAPALMLRTRSHLSKRTPLQSRRNEQRADCCAGDGYTHCGAPERVHSIHVRCQEAAMDVPMSLPPPLPLPRHVLLLE